MLRGLGVRAWAGAQHQLPSSPPQGLSHLQEVQVGCRARSLTPSPAARLFYLTIAWTS